MFPSVKTFFDKATNNATHLVHDPDSSACAVIDSLLDFELASGVTSTGAVDEVISYIRDHDLKVEWVLETHVHTDHLTAAAHLQKCVGGKIGIGEGVRKVQETFSSIYNLSGDLKADGSEFDHLFGDGELFFIGGLECTVLHTPGHTPACVTYVIGDAAFTGDTFFMPDSGTARCDFPGGSATQLYQSLKRILKLSENTRIYINHDYGAGGSRDYAWETTVGDEKRTNIHVGGSVDEKSFVAMREERDASLRMPRLIWPAIQINMCAGHLPKPEGNGTRYLKIPLNLLCG